MALVNIHVGNDKYPFPFIGGPIDFPESAKPAFLVLGRASMAWARIEAHIDALVIHLNKKRHSPSLYQPEHPVGFYSKLKLLKRWFAKHPVLAPLEKNMTKISEMLSEAADVRNLMLHGIFYAYDANTETLSFSNERYQGHGRFVLTFKTMKLAEINAFAQHANDMNMLLFNNITLKLFSSAWIEKLKAS